MGQEYIVMIRVKLDQISASIESVACAWAPSFKKFNISEVSTLFNFIIWTWGIFFELWKKTLWFHNALFNLMLQRHLQMQQVKRLEQYDVN